MAARAGYLRKIRKYREQGYDCVYTDETWINTDHHHKYEWTLAPSLKEDPLFSLIGEHDCSRVVPASKSRRLIILDAGSSTTGWIPGANLVFQSDSGSEDYHQEMNAECFLDWFENTLLPALEKPTVIVLDNASYHNTQVEGTKAPTSASRKAEMREWLNNHEIPFEPVMTCVELLNIIRLNKGERQFETDRLAGLAGHVCLRLPVKHPELNPIEIAWGLEKRYVATHNTTFKMSDVKRLWQEARHVVTKKTWANISRHVMEKVEHKFWDTDVAPLEAGSVIIHLDDSDDDEYDVDDLEPVNDATIDDTTIDNGPTPQYDCCKAEVSLTDIHVHCQLCENYWHPDCSDLIVVRETPVKFTCKKCQKIMRNES